MTLTSVTALVDHFHNYGIFITKQFTLHLRQMIICATERKLTICYRRRNVAAAVDNNCHREPDTLHEYAIMMQNTTPQHERLQRTTIIIFPVITCAQAATSSGGSRAAAEISCLHIACYCCSQGCTNTTLVKYSRALKASSKAIKTLLIYI